MSNIAIIPARGGSKRIEGKNIKDFLGKPIIAYSIETALQSKLFDEIMVSTDNEKIAKIAKNYGAVVPFLRSKKNANDVASTVDVILEVLLNYQNLGKTFEYGCCIYPTAPLTSIEKLTAGYHKLKKGQYDTVFPVVAFSYPIWRGLEITKGEKIRMVWPENLHARSQDLKKVFHDAGQWYWFQAFQLLKEKALFSKNSGAIEISELAVQDIDTLTDWSLAEMKYVLLHGNKSLH